MKYSLWIWNLIIALSEKTPTHLRHGTDEIIASVEARRKFKFKRDSSVRHATNKWSPLNRHAKPKLRNIIELRESYCLSAIGRYHMHYFLFRMLRRTSPFTKVSLSCACSDVNFSRLICNKILTTIRSWKWILILFKLAQVLMLVRIYQRWTFRASSLACL